MNKIMNVSRKEIQRNFSNVAKEAFDKRQITAVTNHGKIEGYFIPEISKKTLETIHKEINDFNLTELENMTSQDVDKILNSISKEEDSAELEEVQEWNQDLGWPYES